VHQVLEPQGLVSATEDVAPRMAASRAARAPALDLRKNELALLQAYE
jgi:hypothetical protein